MNGRTMENTKPETQVVLEQDFQVCKCCHHHAVTPALGNQRDRTVVKPFYCDVKVGTSCEFH